jgi:hypothetical protein
MPWGGPRSIPRSMATGTGGAPSAPKLTATTPVSPDTRASHAAGGSEAIFCAFDE